MSRVKYTSEQNFRHWLAALVLVGAMEDPSSSLFGMDPTRFAPDDCPSSRWKMLVREARLSVPSLRSAVDKHVRTGTRKGKHIESIAR